MGTIIFLLGRLLPERVSLYVSTNKITNKVNDFFLFYKRYFSPDILFVNDKITKITKISL